MIHDCFHHPWRIFDCFHWDWMWIHLLCNMSKLSAYSSFFSLICVSWIECLPHYVRSVFRYGHSLLSVLSHHVVHICLLKAYKTTDAPKQSSGTGNRWGQWSQQFNGDDQRTWGQHFNEGGGLLEERLCKLGRNYRRLNVTLPEDVDKQPLYPLS